MIIEPKFETIGRFFDAHRYASEEFIPSPDDLCPVKLDGKVGYINRKGDMVLTPPYESVGSFSQAGVALAFKDGKGSLIDRTGNPVLPFEFDGYVWTSPPGFIRIIIDKKQGLLNDKGRIVIPAKYNQIYSSGKPGLMNIRLDGEASPDTRKFGLANLEGDILVPVKFDAIHLGSDFGYADWGDKSYPFKFDGTPIGFSYADIE